MVHYHLPSSKTNEKLLYLRKHVTRLLIGLGLICVIIAIFAKNKEAPVSVATNETLKLDTIEKTTSNSKINKVVANAADVEKKLEQDWQVVQISQGDNLSKIFQKLSLPSTLLHEIVNSNPLGQQLINIYSGQELSFLFSESNELKGIKLKISPSKTLNIHLREKEHHYSYDEQKIVTKLSYRENIITDSLYASAQAVSISDKTIMQLADIFSWDIDFVMDIRENDNFRILFEEEYIDNKKIDTGNIVMAEFVNQKQRYQAIRFTDKSGRTGYYSPEGYSMQKAFLRNPVKFTRISSSFSHGRNHPVLHKIRAHKGVDYAAPAGTPVEAAGDGKVVYLGNKGGYGSTIELQHGSKYSTLYAHLSRFQSGIRHGTYVKQGQIIGYVGRTGLATGDHLHYEFRVNGIHRDPLTVKLPKSLPIDKKYRDEFQQYATNMMGLLDQHNSEHLAKN